MRLILQTGLGYGKLLHGEAVAIGMHMAADMSCRMGWVDQELVDRSVVLMEKAGLPVELPKGGGMDMDKFLNVRVLCFYFDSSHCGILVVAWCGVSLERDFGHTLFHLIYAPKTWYVRGVKKRAFM